MKKTSKLIIGVGAIAALGLVIYAVRRHRSNKRHARVADEGYEVAHDILYPGKKNRGKKLRYGPVLPS